MKGALLALGTVVVAGCVSVPSETGRSDVIRRLLPSAVQLRAEGDGGVRRAGTGVVVGAGFDYSWVLTTRHLLAPQTSQNISAAGPGLGRRTPVKLWAVSTEADLALLRIDGVRLPAVPLKDSVRLGDDVWVIALPWGRRLTVVSGVVSQLVVDEAETAVEGAVRLVDASVSYGSSGGGEHRATDAPGACCATRAAGGGARAAAAAATVGAARDRDRGPAREQRRGEGRGAG